MTKTEAAYRARETRSVLKLLAEHPVWYDGAAFDDRGRVAYLARRRGRRAIERLLRSEAKRLERKAKR